MQTRDALTTAATSPPIDPEPGRYRMRTAAHFLPSIPSFRLLFDPTSPLSPFCLVSHPRFSILRVAFVMPHSLIQTLFRSTYNHFQHELVRMYGALTLAQVREVAARHGTAVKNLALFCFCDLPRLCCHDTLLAALV